MRLKVSLEKDRNLKYTLKIRCINKLRYHVEHVHAYIDKYTYSFNRNFMKEKIFENLIKRRVRARPCPYKYIIA